MQNWMHIIRGVVSFVKDVCSGSNGSIAHCALHIELEVHRVGLWKILNFMKKAPSLQLTGNPT